MFSHVSAHLSVATVCTTVRCAGESGSTHASANRRRPSENCASKASASEMYFCASVELSTWKAAQVTLAEHTGMLGPVAVKRTVVMPFQTRIWTSRAWKTTAVELTLVTRVMWNEVTTF